MARFFDQIWRKSMFLRFERVAQIIKQCGSKRVLDVGCGPGWHDVLLAKSSQALHVTGVDLAPNMIQLAKQQAQEHGVSDQCEFSVGDVLDCDFNETFDVVFALGVIEYCESPVEIIHMMYRLADQKVLISLPVEKHILTPKRRWEYKRRRCPLWFYDEAKIAALMNEAKVEHYEIERLARDYLVTMNK